MKDSEYYVGVSEAYCLFTKPSVEMWECQYHMVSYNLFDVNLKNPFDKESYFMKHDIYLMDLIGAIKKAS